ncbi:MAG: PD-(D/E)XK nuclease family protein, partial [Rivularia sp. (in: cyanobacteria)]
MKRQLYLGVSLSQLKKLINNTNFKVITPSPQAARTLKVAHHSLESLASEILKENGVRVATALQSSRLLRAAVSEVIQTLDIEGTTRAINDALKAILRAGVDANELDSVSSLRTQKLARLVQTYTKLLREENIVDSTEVFWQASNIINQPQQLLIYGYFNPRIDQLHFLNKVADDGSIMILPCADKNAFINYLEAINFLENNGWEVEILSQTSASLGEQLQNCFLTGTNLPLGIEAHIYPHLEAEARGVLAQVKSLLSQGISASEIVLVSRDDAKYGSTVLDVAQEYNLPIRAFYGVPLISTRLGAWVELLIEVIQEKFRFESTAKLLSHPLCCHLSANIWREARKQHPATLLEWQNLGVNLALLDWHYEDTRANWVEKMQDVLNKFKIRKGCGRWAREIVAYYKFQDALVDLAKPEDEVISLEEFASDITGTLALLTVPAQPGKGGVELHTPLSLFGAAYKYVFVLGAVEGILPAPIKDDPMLDFYERKQLRKQGFNLEDAVASTQREAISFYNLLQIPTESMIFSYPEMISGTGTLPSSYLTKLGLSFISPPLLPISSIEEARKIYLRQDNLGLHNSLLEDNVLPHAVNAWKIEKRREGAEAYDEYDGVINLPLDYSTRVFSASQLTALGQCAFKWFANKVLRIQELEEAEEELSALLKGNLYHRSLELALSNVKDLTQITANLEAAFLQAEKDSQLPVLSAWEARRSEHLKVLNRACNQPDFCQQGAEVLQLETEFNGEWHGLNVTGRIDRIDRTPEGLVLLDYKSGSSVPPGIKDEVGKANIDIQMPLYI